MQVLKGPLLVSPPIGKELFCRPRLKDLQDKCNSALAIATRMDARNLVLIKKGPLGLMNLNSFSNPNPCAEGDERPVKVAGGDWQNTHLIYDNCAYGNFLFHKGCS
jgi:hypothetical protein